MTVNQECDDDRILGTLNPPYTTRIDRTGLGDITRWDRDTGARESMYVGIAALLLVVHEETRSGDEIATY